MIKRGRILRDTNVGAGLINVDGKQYEFTLEKTWDSDIPPTTGMVVEVELDDNEELIAAWAVDEKELAKEQATILLNATKQRAMGAYSNVSNLTGTPVLIAFVALVLGWFVLSTINIDLSGVYGTKKSISFTFWQMLGIVNNADSSRSLLVADITGASKGFYAVLCIAALAGPFLFIFWKDPLAHLGNCLALVLILIAIGSIYTGYTSQINAGKEAIGAFGGAYAQNIAGMADKLLEQAMKVISVGMGAYLSVIASVYLAFVGIKNYLVASASRRLEFSTTGSSSGAGRASLRRSSQQPSSNGGRTGRVSSETSPLAQSPSKGCPSCQTVSESAVSFCGECGHKFI